MMSDITATLTACKDAIDQLIASGERTGAAWAVPREPGRWSPSQIVEHVARSLEESANVAAGRPSKFPNIPRMLHPIIRAFLLRRVLKTETLPKARTNKAMNPAAGPATPVEGRTRLETAYQMFDAAYRQLASRSERVQTPMFGAVNIEDYVRFMELHARHHNRQMNGSPASR